jgi:hypothetical protein
MLPSAWIKWQVQRGDGSAFSLSHSRRAFAALMEWAEDLPGAKARIVRKTIPKTINNGRDVRLRVVNFCHVICQVSPAPK